MTRRLLRRYFPLIAILCLAPWPIAYAYDAAAGREPVMVRAADPETAPSGRVFGRSISGIKPGSLFYVDATAATTDINVSLTITNSLELSRYLSYLVLRVRVYAENTDGDRQDADFHPAAPPAETIISLTDPEARFRLAGRASYRVTVDGGSLRAMVPTYPGNASVQFRLTATQNPVPGTDRLPPGL